MISIEEFSNRFSGEQDCKQYWKIKREKEGLLCDQCDGFEFRWHSGHFCWICKGCNHSKSLRSGTVMEHSNLPFKIWLKTIFFMSSMKKSISAKQMQALLGLKRYEPVLYMMHKIRAAMGDRDSNYELAGLVELDDGYVTVSSGPKPDIKKKGRGSENKSPILVMVSFETITNKRTKKTYSIPHHYKMYATTDVKTESVIGAVFDGTNIEKTEIKSDKYSGFIKVKDIVRQHHAKVTPFKEAHIHLPWVHSGIGNLKRILNGIHHHISLNNLQLYLDEFCYKLNRRKFDNLFERLIIAGICKSWE